MTVSAIELRQPPIRRQSLWRYWRGGLQGSEFTWAVAFVVPYIAVFLGFVIYPAFYGLWMGSNPALYVEVFSDPIYLNTVVNTLIFLAFGVNVKLFLALLLSGFFMRPGWWTKTLLLIFVLPWAVPALPTFISIHWMLNGEWGLVNNFLYIVFGVVRDMLELGKPQLGVAAVMSALPLLIPLVIILMRKLKTTEVQL